MLSQILLLPGVMGSHALMFCSERIQHPVAGRRSNWSRNPTHLPSAATDTVESRSCCSLGLTHIHSERATTHAVQPWKMSTASLSFPTGSLFSSSVTQPAISRRVCGRAKRFHPLERELFFTGTGYTREYSRGGRAFCSPIAAVGTLLKWEGPDDRLDSPV